MVDLVRQSGVLLTQRIIRQFRQMAHRVEAFEVFDCHAAQILADPRAVRARRIKPAGPVIAGVQTDRVITVRQEIRPQQRADIAVRSGDQNFSLKHPFRPPARRRCNRYARQAKFAARLYPSRQRARVRRKGGTRPCAPLLAHILLKLRELLKRAQKAS